MNSQEIAHEIVAKGLTAPRVTPADIEACIVQEEYFTAADGRFGRWGERSADKGPLALLTFCVLVMKETGRPVAGESVCDSHEAFDPETERQIARQDAIGKLWRLVGDALDTTAGAAPAGE